jgi:hypothetical protein
MIFLLLVAGPFVTIEYFRLKIEYLGCAGVLEYGSVGFESGRISDFLFFSPCVHELQS